MAKDPAFLFYPNDYLGGTMGMTLEEKGAYMELLMLQFNRGHMTSHMIGQAVGQIWDKIKDKFIKDENGLYYNVRLQYEQEKRKRYTQSRNNNVKGTNQFTKNDKNNLGHTTTRMENENVNEDINDLMWSKIKKNFLEDGPWQYKFITDYKIKLPELEKLQSDFLKKMDIQEDYKSLRELKRHFVNTFVKDRKNGAKVIQYENKYQSSSAPLKTADQL